MSVCCDLSKEKHSGAAGPVVLVGPCSHNTRVVRGKEAATGAQGTSASDAVLLLSSAESRCFAKQIAQHCLEDWQKTGAN